MIEKFRIPFAALLVALMALTSCTRNNGDIGDLFGRWKLVTLTADGADVPLYGAEADDDEAQLYAWWFQGSLVWINTIYPHNDFATAKGMWSRTDSQLLLDFSYTDDDGDAYYTPPAALHLVSRGITPLNISSESSSRMHVWYVADDGVRYDYYLTKVY